MTSLTKPKPTPLSHELPKPDPNFDRLNTAQSSRTTPGNDAPTLTPRSTATPTSTPAPGPGRALPSHIAPHSLSRQTFTPQNTPSDGVLSGPIALRLQPNPKATSGTSAPGPRQGVGMGMGRPIGGNGLGLGLGRGAPTPGNTPSSVERLGRRMACNLMIQSPASGTGTGTAMGMGMGSGAGTGMVQGGASGTNRIAPSYERKFNAGLGDLERRLATHTEVGPRSPLQSFTASSPLAPHLDRARAISSEWPTSFSDVTDDTGGTDGEPDVGVDVRETRQSGEVGSEPGAHKQDKDKELVKGA